MLINSKTFKKNPSKRFVGFEMECLAKDRPKKYIEYGRVGEDGSIEPECSEEDDLVGFEFKSCPANGDALLSLIDQVHKKVFKETNAICNESCGFHVHLDMKGTSLTQKANIRNWWKLFQPVFYSFVATHRHENFYCQWIREDIPYECWKNDRDHSLNIVALYDHGTYEVRLHEGTTNKTEIKNWILLLISFFDTFQNIKLTDTRKKHIQKFTKKGLRRFFFIQLMLPRALRNYFNWRTNSYGKSRLRRV
jgi:hypothetical protein